MKLNEIKMNFPLVSVIIPLYNRITLVEETVFSVLQQTYTNFELIIVDDDSNDGSLVLANSLAEKDVRITVYSRPKELPKGANSCRNYGFIKSKGAYVKWLDSDDLLMPNALALQVENIEVSDADVSLCRTIRFSKVDGVENTYTEFGRILTEATIHNYIYFNFQWHTCSALWKSSYFNNHKNIWDNDLMNSQEWLFHLEFLIKGLKIAKVDAFLCKARVHKGSMSNEINKRGKYYYHQCWSRYKAALIMDKYKYPITKDYFYLFRKMIRFNFFIFYKGRPDLAIKTFYFYPKFTLILILSIFRK
jgi:glycosyltransferase involved in cell wall biosynthesis